MLNIKNLSYTYPGRSICTLQNINLELKQGDMLLLAGCSGCGKSTLVKAITGNLQFTKAGKLSGEIYLDDKNSKNLSAEEIGLLVGTVYQTPDDQLFAMNVYDEVAFALENQGIEQQKIKEKVIEILKLVDLENKADSSIHTLSGGQRQRLAVASVLVTEPKLLILDEPVSQMNPQGVSEFLKLLRYLNKKLDITILVVEHRVNELASYFSRIAVMQQGKMIYDGSINDVWQKLSNASFNGIRVPQNIKLCKILGLPALTNNTQLVIEQIKSHCTIKNIVDKTSVKADEYSNPLIEVKNLSFQYSGAKQKTIKNISFNLCKGRITALMGFNGTGKSTLLNILGGLALNYSGSVKMHSMPLKEQLNKIGYLRQEADLMLLADTVLDELLWNNEVISVAEAEQLAKSFKLIEYLNDFPLALSKGQRLRVVLGSILARRPELLLLDEPTTGQDEQSLNAIKEILISYKQQGGCVLFCTHDIELAAEIADTVILMNKGKILADGKVQEILNNENYLYSSGLEPTTVLKISRALQIPPCLRAEDVKYYV